MPKRISIDENEPDASVTPKAKKTTKIITDPELPTEVVSLTPAEHESDVDQELRSKSGRMLSAFSAFPAKVHFSGEEESESIILLLRAHIITNVPWVLMVIILTFLPLIFLPLASAFNFFPFLGIGLTTVLLIFWYLGVFTYGFLNFLYWYFNVYIVTTERIIDVDWYSVVNHDMKFAELSKIEDIAASQFGVIPGLFDFGNVKIETAGTEPNIEFTNIPHPQLVAKKLQELIQDEENESEN